MEVEEVVRKARFCTTKTLEACGEPPRNSTPYAIAGEKHP